MESLAPRYDAIKPHLNERQRRVWLGSEARELGLSGVRGVPDAVGVSPDALGRGRTELDELLPLPVGRSRGAGGGRKRTEEHDPGRPAAQPPSPRHRLLADRHQDQRPRDGSPPITRNQFHGDRSYTLHPTRDTPEPT